MQRQDPGEPPEDHSGDKNTAVPLPPVQVDDVSPCKRSHVFPNFQVWFNPSLQSVPGAQQSFAILSNIYQVASIMSTGQLEPLKKNCTSRE